MSPDVAAFAWAWPRGGHDQLLRAASLADPDAALAAFREWLAVNDIEDVSFREQRLLAMISTRFSDALTDRAERARLVGVERMLWTGSRVALQAAEEALGVLASNGIEVMVFKGVARSALDIRDLRGRVANDVDILVRPNAFRRGYDALARDGWSGGKVDDPTITGINMRKGKHGRIDIHRYPYHQMLMSDAGGSDIWDRAETHEFLGHKIWVPSPTDRLLIAIAHGGIDGHNNSDWLVDSALLIRQGRVDWPLFERLVRQRRLDSYVAVALSYLADRLKAPVPGDVLARILKHGRQSRLKLWSALLQSRPKYDLTTPVNVARGIFRGARQVARGVTLWRLSRIEG